MRLVANQDVWRSCFAHPDRKVQEANMGPIWDWQDPGGHNIGPMNFAIWAHMTDRHPIV